jgi:hypothetical protein
VVFFSKGVLVFLFLSRGSQGESDMKKLALMGIKNMLRSYLIKGLQLAASIVFFFWALEPVHALEFFCASGDVPCLIAAINNANGMPGEHVITLDPGIYSLQIAIGGNGLPSISGSIRIQASADDPPTVIERDPSAAQGFRIFDVSVGGNLSLNGLTLQRGISPGLFSPGAIFNRGVTSLQDSVVTGNFGDAGVITNVGTLNLFRTIVTDNFGGHLAGGIFNELGGTALIEFSTIAHNAADGSGGIFNQGVLVVRNSSIIFNHANGTGVGAGIGNSGYLEIVNSTIAKNSVLSFLFFEEGGGGIANFLGGFTSITNTTIRENESTAGPGGGISNLSGTVRLQDTIVAGNTSVLDFSGSAGPPDCVGTITSVGNNLVGDPSGCAINLQPSDLTGDPGLGALVGAGEEDPPGSAHYPVLAGSPVIDRGNPNACLQTDQLGIFRVGVCDIGAVEFHGPMLVSVDIRPRKDANRINPNSSRDINVAIFSVNGFDATTVNPKTVRFGATGIEAVPIHVAIRDVNGDGHFDMVLQFAIQNTGIACGDTSATLTGQTSQGLSITGSSPIKTVQCKQPKVSRN